jgi:5-carboxymethyl-2-hydroxymuconate isomerase
MNRCHFIDNKLQNDFLLHTIRSRKRPFAKWVKAEKSDDIELVKLVYNLSDSKAREALRLLSEDDMKLLKEKFDIGGKF